MGKMVYTVLTADGDAVTEDDKTANTIVVVHSLTIANNDASIRAFRIRQGNVSGTIIWRIDMNANSQQGFDLKGLLEGLRPDGAGAGDLFMDTDATVCTVSIIAERNKTPRG